MDHIDIFYPSPENQLLKALESFYCSRLCGTPKEFADWYNSISSVTYGWKMMEANPALTQKINQKYEIPEWFMWAVHATI